MRYYSFVPPAEQEDLLGTCIWIKMKDSGEMMLYFACSNVIHPPRTALLCLKCMKLGHDGIDRPNGVCSCSALRRPEQETWEDTRHDGTGCWRVSNSRKKGSREVQHDVKNEH